jgi:hypothetical protein
MSYELRAASQLRVDLPFRARNSRLKARSSMAFFLPLR